MSPHHRLLNAALVLAVTALMLGCQPQTSTDTATRTVSAEAYQRAERFLFGNQSKYLLNHGISPNWIAEEDRFWYRRALADGGGEFVTVDANSGEKSRSFDHALIAAELTRLQEDQDYTATTLPFQSFTFNEDGGIDFTAGDAYYSCTNEVCEIAEPPTPPFSPIEIPSPDGAWAAYHKDHNLWVRSVDDETHIQLTQDGEEAWGYGTQTGTSVAYISTERLLGGNPPQIKWSPDSSKILTQRIDEREVKELSIIEHAPRDGSLRPRTHTMRYAFARDEAKPRASFVVFDIPSGERMDIDYPEIELLYATMTHPQSREVWWSEDSQGFGFVHRKAFSRGYSIHRVELETGEVELEVDRTSERTSSPGFSTPVPPQVLDLADGRLVWYSDESGYGHLYCKESDGTNTQITAGEWNVATILHFDQKADRVYFFGSQPESEGNPYYHFIYGVNLDGSGFQKITPETANHASVFTLMAPVNIFSPSGNFLVATWNTATQPGQTELRRTDGSLVAVLETADASPLEEQGFVYPESFTVFAADGETRLYGSLFFPSDFDPDKSYPILDSIYPGPQVWREPHLFADSVFSAFETQTLAELGFIVMSVDGRGTPGRSRDFHFPPGVNMLDKAGHLEDHIAAIEQLAEARPYIDKNRVGIFGWSGGGYASTHAILSYPDFFKVAVSGAGNHDPRTYLPIWGESYQGDTDDAYYEAGSNAHLAGNLKGKLFLVHGALDDNVHPGNTYALVDALIQANKDFDLLVLPNAAHGPGDAGPYFQRRQWDYFVTRLLGAQTPQGYKIGGELE